MGQKEDQQCACLSLEQWMGPLHSQFASRDGADGRVMMVVGC